MIEENNKSTKKRSLVEIVSDLISALNEKEKRTITGRFGLSGKKETLSAIGRELRLSRERIRQIEKNSLRKLAIEFSKNNKNEATEVINLFENSAGIVVDSKISNELVNLTYNHKFAKSYLKLIFSIMSETKKIEENSDLNSGWILTSKISKKKIQTICDKLIKHFKEYKLPQTVDDIIAEVVGISTFSEELISSCIDLSTKLVMAKNGMVGITSWPSVNPRNVKDKIYYVLKTAGRPLHFSEITSSIIALKFDNKKVVRATVHNELIADKRFVLIGRGIYALREWGYSDGTVYDVIKNILSNATGPLSIGEIIALVNKSRKVKKNTIVINLQTKKEFAKVNDGYIYKNL